MTTEPDLTTGANPSIRRGQDGEADRPIPDPEARSRMYRDALERNRRVEEQLAAVGIKLGGYRLRHPLDGPIRPLGQRVWRRDDAADQDGSLTTTDIPRGAE